MIPTIQPVTTLPQTMSPTTPTVIAEVQPVDAAAGEEKASVGVMPVIQQEMTETTSMFQPEPAELSRPAIEETQVQTHAEMQKVEHEDTGSLASAGTQETVARTLPGQLSSAVRPDYGWVLEALWSRVEQLKRYPYVARVNRWEGKVVLRMIIGQDGQLLDLAVAESSGHVLLDRDAQEIVAQAFPLKLTQALEKPQVVVHIPLTYRLDP